MGYRKILQGFINHLWRGHLWLPVQKSFGARLVGDCLLNAAFVSYAGPFNHEFRKDARQPFPLAMNLMKDSLKDTVMTQETGRHQTEPVKLVQRLSNTLSGNGLRGLARKVEDQGSDA